MGLGLLLLALLPVYRVLDAPATGFPGAQTVAAAERTFRMMWRDTGFVLLLALPAALWLRERRLDQALRRSGELLTRPSRRAFAMTAATLAFVASGAFALLVVDGKPVLTDAVAQLVQGRYVAEGSLAGPTLERPEFWVFQFMVETPQGWVSQYPPLHSVVLAAGFLAGAVWTTGPVLMAVTAALSVAVAERLLPEDPVLARLAGLLAGLSPLLLGLAGSYMNHATAVALALGAAYFALRARDGAAAWALAAGTAVGALVATRPLTGLVVGPVVTLGVWLTRRDGGEKGRRRPEGPGPTADLRGLLSRLGLALGGALPFAAALSLYNLRFFENPFRFGYLAGTGPRHAPGFHLDPWGNVYGPLQALGYTSSDLLALGRDLLGTPVSLVAVAGAYLLVARRLRPGVRVLLAWAVLPVMAHAFYWHHDLVLGPRMLAEAGPAWAALGVMAAAGLVRRIPRDVTWPGGFSPRTALTSALLLALASGLLWFGPTRLAGLGDRVTADPIWISGPAGARSEGGRDTARGRSPPSGSPALVFIHEAWPDRLGARLTARGFRLDSVRSLISSYPPCSIQATLDGISGQEARGECRRQAAADRLGGLNLPSYLWWGDLPGLESSGALWVRDLGPDRNAVLLDRFPERKPWMLLPPAEEGRPPRAVPYRAGVSLLWEPPTRSGGAEP